jgi:hypothetical protein
VICIMHIVSFHTANHRETSVALTSTESSIRDSSPDTLSIGTNPLDDTPPTSQAPIPHYQPPEEPMMMSTTVIPKFSGEAGDDVKPGDFLKTFQNAMHERKITDDAVRIEEFGVHLKDRSMAEEWFKDVSTLKDTWINFQTAFTSRFPGVTKAKKTGIDLERDQQTLRIAVEDLGKTERYGGEDVWTHIAFAEKVLDLAKQAKINDTTNLIWMVCDNLPNVLKEKVNETQADWKAFCKAIKDIELSYIWEGVKKYREKKADKEEVLARIGRIERGGTAVPDTPMSSIRQQMAQTTIQPAVTTQINTTMSSNYPRNPFTVTSGG